MTLRSTERRRSTQATNRNLAGRSFPMCYVAIAGTDIVITLSRLRQ